MTEQIDFEGAGTGKAIGHLATPAGTSRGGIVVVQEWWGVTPHMKDVTERFAKEGYTALAPDLYDGKSTKDPAEALKLVQALDWPKAASRVAGAAEELRKRGAAKVGVVGFCAGGALALWGGALDPKITAVVSFYGVPPLEHAPVETIAAPVLGHFAKNDEHITQDSIKALEAKLQTRSASTEIHMYDAQHAFFNDTRPEVYDAASAKTAWERTLAFFKANVG